MEGGNWAVARGSAEQTCEQILLQTSPRDVVLPGQGLLLLVWLLAGDVFLVQWFAKTPGSRINRHQPRCAGVPAGRCVSELLSLGGGDVKRTHSTGRVPVTRKRGFSVPVAAR